MEKQKSSKIDRYPGIRSFEETDQNIFFGREKEIDELFTQVKIKPLVVLFSKSGLGKSSLIKAGLNPVLLKERFFPIMIRLQDKQIVPIKAVLNELKHYQKKQRPKGISASSNQLWETLHACEFPTDHSPNVTPVLIFDQFEELFSHDPEQQHLWASQIADLVEERLPEDIQQQLQNIPRRKRTAEQLEWFQPVQIKVMLAIRSDRMSLMHSLRHEIPSILQQRYELYSLNSLAARNAIEQPAAMLGDNYSTFPFSFAPETIAIILENLSDEYGEIESFQLQIICQHIEKEVESIQFPKDKLPMKIWQKIIGKKNEVDVKNVVVTPDILGGPNGIGKILKNYYKDQIATLKSSDQPKARILLEKDLIVEGHRVGIADVVIRTKHGIEANLINDLMETRLIRAEKSRLGEGVIYEISHDTLVQPILESSGKRIQKNRRKLAAIVTAIVTALIVFLLSSIYFSEKEKDEIAAQESTIKELKEKKEELEKELVTAGKNPMDTADAKFLAKIKKFEKLVHAMDPSYFEYDSIHHNHILKVPITFNPSSSSLNNISPSSQLSKLDDAGQMIITLVDSMKNENLHYVVIIEGQASKDKFKKNDKLSYQRALAVLNHWEDRGINIRKNKNIELIIAGSGTGGILRDQIESNNRRFLIQIIPKFELND